MSTTTPKQRSEMYGDLFQLLVPGFLTTKVTVGDHVYSLRSLTTRDLYLLSGVVKEGLPEWKPWVCAASVWMADGVCLLEETNAPKVFRDVLVKSHKGLTQSFFGTVLNFFSRVKKANTYLESFLYEEESRRLWHSTLRGGVTLPQMAGVPGADRLGLNLVQSSWIAWNLLEDEREDQEYQWSLVKVNVALQSNKSAQKLEARDKNRHEMEKARRADIQDRAYRIFKGEIDPDNGSVVRANGLEVRAPKTNAELVEEMQHWLRGELDDHDRIVSEYKERIRREYLANEEARVAAIEEARKRREKVQVDLGSQRTKLVAFSPKELADKFPGMQRQGGAKFITEADPVSRTFNRYLRDEQIPYGLTVDGDTVKMETPVDQPRVPIHDLIANRKPKFNGQ